MINFLTIFHSIVSIILILIVLLQFGKGAEAGLMMDVSSSSILPQKGNILVKITSILAILFLSISLSLAILRGKQSQKSLFDKVQSVEAPLHSGQAPKSATENSTVPPESPKKDAPK